jgi:hypothetical protein
MRSQMLACLLQSAAALTLNAFSCRVTLNIGREPGTWMPDDWAASGARMSLPLDVTFSDEPVECTEPNFLQNRDVKLPSLPGEGSSTSRLQCSGGSFVGAQGEVVVKADGGAWSAQPTGQCGEHLLRFYLDFPEGAARNDVSLPAGRVYFSSACWDKEERAEAEAEVDLLKKEIEGIIDTKEAAADYAKAKGEDGGDGLSFLESANAFRKAKQRSDKANPLVERYKGMVGSLPNEVVSAGQVDLLTKGGIQIKGNGAKNLWGALGDVFLILGRFTISEA